MQIFYMDINFENVAVYLFVLHFEVINLIFYLGSKYFPFILLCSPMDYKSVTFLFE